MIGFQNIYQNMWANIIHENSLLRFEFRIKIFMRTRSRYWSIQGKYKHKNSAGVVFVDIRSVFVGL